MTKSKEQSYIVSKTGKLILEVSTRKKARRIARRKYAEQYTEKKTYIIISGATLKKALLSLKNEIAARNKTPKLSPAKKTASSKSKKKKAAVKKTTKKKAVSKKTNRSETSMLDDALFQEEKQLKRLNKKNQK